MLPPVIPFRRRYACSVTACPASRRPCDLAARRCGLGDHRVDVVLGQAGLAERAGDAVAGYSFGMRQRLGVAAAAALRPVSLCPL